MPENDFEKQVQQKMDELKFVPSAAVWPEVERQIEQRKKRRGIFFWLPLGVLLLGAGAWLYLFRVNNTGVKKQTADNAITTDSTNDKNITNNGVVVNNAVTSENKKAFTRKDGTHKLIKGEPTTEKRNIVINRNDATATKKSSHKDQKDKPRAEKMIDLVTSRIQEKISSADAKISGHKNKNFIKTYSSNAVAKKNVAKDKFIAANDANKETTVAVSPTVEEKSNVANDVIAQSTQQKNDKAVAGSVAAKDLVVSKTVSDSLKNENKTGTGKAVVKNKAKPTTKKKIEWGINVNAGVSSISNGFNQFFSSTPAYDARAFASNQQTAPVNLGGGSLSSTISNPSDIKPGFSYTAGMFIRVPLNKKFSFLTGINYAYYSNHLMVGAKSDSGMMRYATGNLNSYTNQFHFIEIPIAIQLHTARFAINGGFSFSMLAGTNALLYDAQANYYYKDNSLINKMQAGLLAGFSYRLFPKTTPIEIGPQLNYNLSTIFNKDLYGSRHLIFAGINAKFYLQKNNPNKVAERK